METDILVGLAILGGTDEELDDIEESLNYTGDLDEESLYIIDAHFI